MKNKILVVCALLLVAIGFAPPAKAQEAGPAEIIFINSPISAELRQALDAWLLTSRPSPAVYYAVTYWQPVPNSITDTYVSLVGLNIATPDVQWSMVENPETGETFVIWMDTILVHADGSVNTDPFEMSTTAAPFAKFADLKNIPQLGAGGGSYVRFPWQPGKAVQFGIFGAHAAGYASSLETTSDWLAVDLVSGSDMGSGAANDKVYASVGGSITHICDEGDSVAVRISGGGDSMLYAHLLPNTNLELGHAFSSGQYIGSLKHGSFADACGWAAQQDDHWHLHWGFITSGSNPRTFKAEGCQMIKSAVVTSGIWECGDKTILVLDFLYHYGNISQDPDTGEYNYDNEGGERQTFWNYMLSGFTQLLDAMITNLLPAHDSTRLAIFTNVIMNSVKVVFRIALVLLRGNLNLKPAMVVVSYAILINLGMNTLALVGYVIRIIKSIPLVP